MIVSLIRLSAFVLATLLTPSLASAQYRCVENGKTLFTDKPCNSEPTPPPVGSAPKVIGDSGNSGYASPYGDWRGQVQYQASYQTKPIADAHAVVQTTISISSQGKVTGSSPENGCKMKGVASPGMSKNLLNLDITLSGCSYDKLNRRLFGTLAMYPAEQHAQFWIYAHPVDLLNPGWGFDIKGTMRR